jgi:indolepyruvate ferredoxin oxidoreductase beta subunit
MLKNMSTPHTINIAIMALGGQGGGVLVDWIVDMAEHEGWIAQATSVAGVAQRTGATIYYIELIKNNGNVQNQKLPVLALVPVPGEVDILIAAELIEASRAHQRGLITKDRTTVIASSHRTFAIEEKMAPSNGVFDTKPAVKQLEDSAKKLFLFDMQQLASEHQSVISSTLFGALMASGTLPFEPIAFENAIRRAQLGVNASLLAFTAAAQRAAQVPSLQTVGVEFTTAARKLPEQSPNFELNQLLTQIRANLDPSSWDMVGEGIERLVNYQSIELAKKYVSHLMRIQNALRLKTSSTHASFMMELARHLARALSYEDIIRVAQLKTQSVRMTRIAQELNAPRDAMIQVEEYFHPGMGEVCAMLPKSLGMALLNNPTLQKWIEPIVNKGRRIQTHSLMGFVLLRTLSSLKWTRPMSLRHATETAHINHWLASIEQALDVSVDLAFEVVLTQRLIKGYSDTHERSSSKYHLLMRALPILQSHAQAAQLFKELRLCALSHVSIKELSKQLQSLNIQLS